MTDAAQTTATYVLPLTEGFPPPAPSLEGRFLALPGPLLLRNVLWFCRLRWVVVATLAALGALSAWPALVARLGWRPHPDWPLAAAGVLALGNLTFLGHARLLVRSHTPDGATVNLWCQIVLDLCVLTVVVHFAGSLETYAAFAYLFHIVLACIFFSRRRSLVIVGLACGLYAACVRLETLGVLAPSSIYAASAIRQAILATRGAVTFNVLFAMGMWLVVWYLTSHLSERVRQRDEELAATNARLLEAQEEKTRHMLRTTHELKAPFAAIHANTHLLLKGHCGPLSPDARGVVERIARRAARLAHEIQEMLQLANLRSVREDSMVWAEHDVAEVLSWCVDQARSSAQERGVTVEADLAPARVRGVLDHLKMLFGNLLSNAIAYSHEGGRVRVTSRSGRFPPVTSQDGDWPFEGGQVSARPGRRAAASRPGPAQEGDGAQWTGQAPGDRTSGVGSGSPSEPAPEASGPTPYAGAVVTVEDHGIGIPADKLPLIFDEYYRTDEAAQHNKDSSGLGLAIVRHVARSHGIGVRVQSRPGAGTLFTLTFLTNGRKVKAGKETGEWRI
jgi:two-component system phosphate regulon sensor histidine kinase PhoR